MPGLFLGVMLFPKNFAVNLFREAEINALAGRTSQRWQLLDSMDYFKKRKIYFA